MLIPSPPHSFVPLGDVAPDEGLEPGFTHRHVAFVVVIGASGQLVAIEDLPGYRQVRRMRMRAPQPRRRSRGMVANFLCDNTGFALGVRLDKRSQAGFRVDAAAFDCFRELHKCALQDVADTTVQVFLKFLDHWSPQAFQDLPGFMDRLDLTLAFRFQYDDELLHERHAARMAWKRLFAAESGRSDEPGQDRADPTQGATGSLRPPAADQ